MNQMETQLSCVKYGRTSRSIYIIVYIFILLFVINLCSATLLLHRFIVIKLVLKVEKYGQMTQNLQVYPFKI